MAKRTPNPPEVTAPPGVTKPPRKTRRDLETKARKTDKAKTLFLEALQKSMGIISKAADISGLSRDQHYHWMEVDPGYKAAVEAILERRIDFVESKLFELINGVKTVIKVDGKDQVVYTTPPDKTAIIFFLKTIAKKRGYTERTELTGIDGQALVRTDNKTLVIERPPPRK